MTDAWDSNPYKDEPVLRFFRELNTVKNDARSLVLVTNGILELLIESLVRAKCKHFKRITEDNRTYPYSAKLVLLSELGILSDDEYRLFDWFRKIRNRAAHEALFELKENDFQKINPPEYRSPSKLYDICFGLVGSFWNKHVPIFGPVFAPKIVGAQRAEQSPPPYSSPAAGLESGEA